MTQTEPTRTQIVQIFTQRLRSGAKRSIERYTLWLLCTHKVRRNRHGGSAVHERGQLDLIVCAEKLTHAKQRSKRAMRFVQCVNLAEERGMMTAHIARDQAGARNESKLMQTLSGT